MKREVVPSLDYRYLLLEEFLSNRRRNVRFSLRAFSKRLGVSHSVISEILSGKRPLTRKMAVKFSDRLSLDPAKSQLLLRGVVLSKIQNELPEDTEINRLTDKSFHSLELEKFKMISDWYHFGILSLLEVEGARPNPKWIAKRLGITEKNARDALKRLTLLGLIKQTGRSLKLPEKSLSIYTQGYDSAMRNNIAQHLERARVSLENDPAEVRELSTTTLAISSKNIPKAREAIKRFRRELSMLLERESRDRVYSLSVQLFPLDTMEE